MGESEGALVSGGHLFKISGDRSGAYLKEALTQGGGGALV